MLDEQGIFITYAPVDTAYGHSENNLREWIKPRLFSAMDCAKTIA